MAECIRKGCGLGIAVLLQMEGRLSWRPGRDVARPSNQPLGLDDGFAPAAGDSFGFAPDELKLKDHCASAFFKNSGIACPVTRKPISHFSFERIIAVGAIAFRKDSQ